MENHLSLSEKNSLFHPKEHVFIRESRAAVSCRLATASDKRLPNHLESSWPRRTSFVEEFLMAFHDDNPESR